VRAVLDTNVVISGALSSGSPPAQALQAARDGSFEMIISGALLQELRSVMGRPKIRGRLGWSTEETAQFVGGLMDGALVVTPALAVAVVKEDEADNRVLEAAIAGDADYIVTGDRHLLDIREYEGISIVTPARFAAILAAPA
jgi:putative PIN family toxin of toxin-antitoxin system